MEAAAIQKDSHLAVCPQVPQLPTGEEPHAAGLLLASVFKASADQPPAQRRLHQGMHRCTKPEGLVFVM